MSQFSFLFPSHESGKVTNSILSIKAIGGELGIDESKDTLEPASVSYYSLNAMGNLQEKLALPWHCTGTSPTEL